ncbi:type II secretion system protein [Rubellicoccus peritrichatus]|uniref:Type II secretion system protein n=1 Tax=Rubellicoccus peritrichatus TaxID=3080537 RepID=A0AAQ3L5X4_9BACT|nr:type II secretion system protein [Puniceicoccus sp. CR14]WOO39372.1 type II secretion system protein [Puniceicoccus sp. CR14]
MFSPYPGHSFHSKKGFSLIEILAAISIVSVLFAIILVGMGSMSDKANEAITASRLKQVHAAQMLYAQDHDGIVTPFYGNADSGDNEMTWQRRLFPYVDVADVEGAAEDPESVLNSPYQNMVEGVPYWKRGRSFGLNSYLAHSNWRYNVARVPQPAKIVLAGDKVQGNSDYMNTSDGYSWVGSGSTWGLPAYRHNGKTTAMFVFMDGHTEVLTEEDLELSPETRQSVWRWW